MSAVVTSGQYKKGLHPELFSPSSIRRFHSWKTKFKGQYDVSIYPPKLFSSCLYQLIQLKKSLSCSFHSFFVVLACLPNATRPQCDRRIITQLPTWISSKTLWIHRRNTEVRGDLGFQKEAMYWENGRWRNNFKIIKLA